MDLSKLCLSTIRLLTALFLLTLWMKVMASAWVQFSRDRPLTSSISSQTSRSALSAGDPENITNSVSNYMYHFYNIQKAHGHHCSPEKQFLAINSFTVKSYNYKSMLFKNSVVCTHIPFEN